MKKMKLCYFCARDKRRAGRHLISREAGESYGTCDCCKCMDKVQSYISVPARK